LAAKKAPRSKADLERKEKGVRIRDSRGNCRRGGKKKGEGEIKGKRKRTPFLTEWENGPRARRRKEERVSARGAEKKEGAGMQSRGKENARGE